MFKSSDHYTMVVQKDIPEIREILLLNTLNKSSLVREKTNRIFIGKVNEQDFLLMSSSATGVLCTISGKFKTTEDGTTIEVDTKIKQAFLVLFVFWIIAMGGLFIAIPYLNGSIPQITVGPIVMLIIAAVFFRFVLHKGYAHSRDQGIRNLEMLLY